MTYHARFWAIKQNFVRSNSVLVKRIAKEMCNMRVFVHEMWAPVVMHKVHNAYGLHPDRQNTRFLVWLKGGAIFCYFLLLSAIFCYFGT